MSMTAIELRCKLLLFNLLLIALAVMLTSCGIIEKRTRKLLFFDRGGEPVFLHEIFRLTIYDEMAEAIENGDPDRFKALYGDSQLVNSKGRSGITLLWLAVKFQQEEIVEFLLDRGASPDVEIDWVSSIIGLAAEGDSAILRRILTAGASIDHKSGGMSRSLPVHHAARIDGIENMKMLLEAGANVNSRTETGLTPLSLAVAHRNIELVLYLLEAGADPTITNNYGASAVSSLVRENPNRISLKDVARVREWLTAHGYDIDELAKNQMKEGKQSSF